MKSVLLTLFVFFAFSCDKDISLTKYCWTCKSYVTVTVDGQSSSATSVTDYCNKSNKEIEDIEKGATYTTTTTSGGTKVVNKVTTSCSRK